MRVQVAVVVLGALAALFGGWLVARWCLGLVVIAESACGVVWGLTADDGRGEPAAAVLGMPRHLYEAIERARAS